MTTKQYFEILIKKSMIPSVLAITRATTSKEKIWKSSMVIVCFIGFTYQAYDYISFYFTYPTTVDMREYYPTNIVLPAVTFCSSNRINRKKYCDIYWGQCDAYNFDEFCDKYPRYCYPSPDKNHTKVPKDYYRNSMKMQSFSWKFAGSFTHTSDMIEKCIKIVNATVTACNNESEVTKAYLTDDYNRNTVCYTVGSSMNDIDSKSTEYPIHMSYSFILNTFQDYYIDLDDPVMIYVSVHDRKHVSNPFIDGFALKGGTKYRAAVSMTEVIRLPPPYQTMCTDYVSLWTKNNGAGPLNGFECIEHCKAISLIAEGKCLDRHVSYPHNGSNDYERVCHEGRLSMTDTIIEKCNQECYEACYENTYEVVYLDEGKQNLQCPEKNEGCRLQNIDLTFSFRNFQVTSYIHLAKIPLSEMFTSVGLYLVVWLGISLVVLLDVLEMILKLCYHGFC